MSTLSELYFTPNSLNVLSMVVLCLTIAGYFLFQKKKTETIWQLLFYFAGLTIALIFALFFELVPNYHPWVTFTASLAAAFFSTSLLGLTAFTYQFPYRLPHQERERTVALISTFMIIVVQIALFIQLLQFTNVGIFFTQTAIIVCQWTWIIVLFIRRWVYFYRKQQLSEAKALRSLVMSFLPFLIVSIINLFFTASAVVYIATFISLFTFTLSYINYAPHSATFMVKLVGISFITVLIIFGNLGYVIAPLFENVYPVSTDVNTNQSLHFQLNTHHSYDVTGLPFYFDNDLGERLAIQPSGYQNIPLDFNFPLYDQIYSNLQVFSSGYVTFVDNPPSLFTGDGLKFPTIFATWLVFNPNSENGGIFYKQTDDQIIITWYQLLPLNQIDDVIQTNVNHYTTQLIMYSDGAFTITVRDIPAYKFHIASKRDLLRGIGVNPGKGDIEGMVNVQFESELPYQSTQIQPILQTYDRDFFQFVDKALRPLAYLILGISPLILIIFPLFFQFNLVKPLYRLVEGVQTVESRDLSVRVPVTYQDEIGYVTRQFNEMVEQLADLYDGLEKKVADRTAQLEEQNEELDAFAHTVAHDLQTPLTTIAGYSDLLVSTYDKMPSELIQQQLKLIAKTSHKMSKIISEILTLATLRRVEDIATAPIEMGKVIEEVQNRLAEMIAEYEGTIILPEEWHIALGYAPWIEEVWANYLSNALKYGGKPPLVVLGSEFLAEQGMVRFWIEDNGIGLTKEAKAKLFNQLTQLNQKMATGHGLGLSIVKRIVNKLGGQVGVESLRQGSRFWFTLPVASASEPKTNQQ